IPTIWKNLDLHFLNKLILRSSASTVEFYRFDLIPIFFREVLSRRVAPMNILPHAPQIIALFPDRFKPVEFLGTTYKCMSRAHSTVRFPKLPNRYSRIFLLFF